MTQDPGLFTDSTGEGTVGGTDVRFSTQQELKTKYNGSKYCKDCGYTLDPYQALLNELCPSCSRHSKAKLVKGRMTNDRS